MASRTPEWREVGEGEEFICYKALKTGLAVLRVPASALTNAPMYATHLAPVSDMIYAAKFRASQVHVLEIFEFIDEEQTEVQKVDRMPNEARGDAKTIEYECGKDLPRVDIPAGSCSVDPCGPGYHFFLHWEAAYTFCDYGRSARTISPHVSDQEKVRWYASWWEVEVVRTGMQDWELDQLLKPTRLLIERLGGLHYEIDELPNSPRILIEPWARFYYEIDEHMQIRRITHYDYRGGVWSYNANRDLIGDGIPLRLNAPYPTEEESAYVKKPQVLILHCPLADEPIKEA